MIVKKRFFGMAISTGIFWLAVSSCSLSAEEGQLSCAENPCPGDMFCYQVDLRCYSSEENIPLDKDASIDTEIDTADIEDDLCPDDPNKTEPGLCGCGLSDTDDDGDGAICDDECPNDPDKTEPGICGCGVSDRDTGDRDGDGTIDCLDGCPDDYWKSDPGACGCFEIETLDDTDGDGTIDCLDECESDKNKIEPGVCGCGISDQDSDNDGTVDCNDSCKTDPAKTVPGICGCGISDQDSDNDGTADCNDSCETDPAKTVPGICGCGISDRDSDNDGRVDCRDDCPYDEFKTTPGLCGCGSPESKCEILCVEALDHEYATLDCTTTGTIERIEFASFGHPLGSCSGPEPSVGSCDAVDAPSIIRNDCEGLSSCEIEADKDVLGDPKCPKDPKKKLIVLYFCRYW